MSEWIKLEKPRKKSEEYDRLKRKVSEQVELIANALMDYDVEIRRTKDGISVAEIKKTVIYR